MLQQCYLPPGKKNAAAESSDAFQNILLQHAV